MAGEGYVETRFGCELYPVEVLLANKLKRQGSSLQLKDIRAPDNIGNNIVSSRSLDVGLSVFLVGYAFMFSVYGK